MDAPPARTHVVTVAALAALTHVRALPASIMRPVETRHPAGRPMSRTRDSGQGGEGTSSDGETSLDLLIRAREGDRAALDRLVERLLPPLRHWATHRLPQSVRDLQDTDDLIQEAVAAAVAKLGSFEYRGTGSLHAYVRQILLNRIRDELERARRRPPHAPLDEGEADPAPSPLEQTIGHDLLERYEHGLLRLEDDEREAIVARLELGLPYAEIAKLLNRPSPDAARMAVARALVRLAKEMRRERG